MKIVGISDTHCRLRKMELPEGDMLIHSGDLTFQGNIAEISQELRELERLKSKYKYIIFVDGNHDWLGQRNPELMRQMCKDAGIIYLQDESVEIEGIKIYGSPWQPAFCNWAFNLPRGEKLKAKWAMIPNDTNILVTHSPPYGILDTVERWNGPNCEFDLEHVGCEELYLRVMELPNLKFHQFGHIHKDYGTIQMGNTTFINASSCNEAYKPVNKPIVYEYKT